MRYQEAYVEVVGIVSALKSCRRIHFLFFNWKILFVCLSCIVPPDIIDSESSTDTVVREGSNVSLTCAASGHPQPHILDKFKDSNVLTFSSKFLPIFRPCTISIGL